MLQNKCLLVLLFLCTMILQSCGGGKSDTNGSLTLSNPVLTANGDGSYAVAVTATFTPPAGKVPNGVEIHFVVTGNGITLYSFDETLTSSPTVTETFTIPQSTASSVSIRISASIGDMESSVGTNVPALGAVNAAPVQFSDIDPAFTTKTSPVWGGVPPYTLQSANPADLTASIVGGTTFSVTKNSATGVDAQPPVYFTVMDARGNLGIVQVNYFK